jgi:hypothetical protein
MSPEINKTLSTYIAGARLPQRGVVCRQSRGLFKDR